MSNKNTFIAGLTTYIPDNTTELVAPEDERTVFENMANDVMWKDEDSYLRTGTTTMPSADIYTLTLTDAYPSAYSATVPLLIKISNTNTGAATLNINGLGGKNWRDADGNALAAGALAANSYHFVIYDSANDRFITLMSSSGSTSSGVTRSSAGTLTLSSPGKYIHTGSGATWTLTTGTAALVGREFDLFNDGTGAIIMAYSGGNSAVSTFGGNIDAGTGAIIFWDGTKWIVKQ